MNKIVILFLSIYLILFSGCGDKVNSSSLLNDNVEVTYSLKEGFDDIYVETKVKENLSDGRKLKKSETINVGGIYLGDEQYNPNTKSYLVTLSSQKLKSQVEISIKFSGNKEEQKISSKIPLITGVSLKIKDKKIKNKNDLHEYISASEVDKFLTCIEFNTDNSSPTQSVRMTYKANLTIPALSDYDKSEVFGWGWFLKHLDENNNYEGQSMVVYKKSGDCYAPVYIFPGLEKDIPGMTINSLSMQPRFEFDKIISLDQITILEQFQIYTANHTIY